MTIIWCIWCVVPEISSMTKRTFCHFGPFFALLPIKNPTNKNFEKMKKLAGDIIVLHMCTINHNHTMYGPWDMKCEGHNFLSFWTSFCPFTPLKTQKIRILKIFKKNKCNKNHDHMLHCSWDTMSDRCNSYFLFWAIFCSFTPLTTEKNQNFKKLKKKRYNFTCVPKITITWCTVPEIWFTMDRWTDERMDGETEKVKCKGGCPT